MQGRQRLRNARLTFVPIVALGGRRLVSVPQHSTVQEAKDAAADELKVANVELVEAGATAPIRGYADDGMKLTLGRDVTLLHALSLPITLKLCVSFSGWLQVVPRGVALDLRESDTLEELLAKFQNTRMIGVQWDDMTGEQMWSCLQRVPRRDLRVIGRGGDVRRVVRRPLQLPLGCLRGDGAELHLTFDLDQIEFMLFSSEHDALDWARKQGRAVQLDPAIDVDAIVDRDPSVDAWTDYFLASF
jgi:hypothetical protein